MSSLSEEAWELLHAALDLYRIDPLAGDELHRQLTRFTGPLRIAITGPAGSGKSTLINALLGEEVAPVVPNASAWYVDGSSPRLTAHTADGYPHDVPVTRSAAGLRVDTGSLPIAAEEFVVQWPTRALRNASLLDAPAGSNVDSADAVVVLGADPGESGGQIAPVHKLLVLARADEIGGGRIEALVTAKQLARQRSQDPSVSLACQGVLAFSGKVALASRMLTEPDFACLATMAAAPRADLDLSLLSTDRFVGPEFPAPVGGDARQALLARFGLHGLRLAMSLIRMGCDDRAKLAAELARRSGLTELREALSHHFLERREVLKARSVLVAVETVLGKDSGSGPDELRAHLERVLAGAHEFRELRLLAALHAAGFAPDLSDEAHRLIGGNGAHPTTRLGVDESTPDEELWDLTTDALWRWQNVADDPHLDLSGRRAARVVVRSCEGLIASLS